MKKRLANSIYLIVAISCIISLYTRCAMNLSGFQTARTVGKENIEATVSYSKSKTPILFDTSDIKPTFENAINRVGHIESNLQFGIAERLDIGLQIGLPSNIIGMDGKYLLSKSNNSLFAISVGAGGGLNSGGYYLQIPVYFSVHPSENMAIYYTPRQIFQYGSRFFGSKRISVRGFNGGVLFGKGNLRFGLDAGYFIGHTKNYDFNLNSIGFGIKLKFKTKRE